MHFQSLLILSFSGCGLSTLFAPYQYSWSADSDAYYVKDLAEVSSKTSISAVTVAFLIADAQGHIAQEVINMIPSIKTFIASGNRKVILSVGGANGPYLEQTMSADVMFKEVDDLLQQTGVRELDFDIEGPLVSDKASRQVRNSVIKQLQSKYPELYVSFTLPVAAVVASQPGQGGLTAEGLGLVQEAVQQGVQVDVVNGMAMDYYAALGGESLGQVACSVADKLKDQLKTVYPAKSDSLLYQMIGLTPMIGVNDDANEVFSVADATTMATCAKQKGIGLISMWALQRDQTGSSSLGITSKVNKNQLDFVQAIATVLKGSGDATSNSTVDASSVETSQNTTTLAPALPANSSAIL